MDKAKQFLKDHGITKTKLIAGVIGGVVVTFWAKHIIKRGIEEAGGVNRTVIIARVEESK